MKLNNIILFVAVALIGATSMMGCRKKKETLAKIYVRDAANQPVEGASVVLYGETTTTPPKNPILFDTTLTNSSGEAVFNYDEVYQLGQAGVAVLNIKAKKNTSIGTGIIKIEEEKTNTETVYIQ